MGNSADIREYLISEILPNGRQQYSRGSMLHFRRLAEEMLLRKDDGVSAIDLVDQESLSVLDRYVPPAPIPDYLDYYGVTSEFPAWERAVAYLRSLDTSPDARRVLDDLLDRYSAENADRRFSVDQFLRAYSDVVVDLPVQCDPGLLADVLKEARRLMESYTREEEDRDAKLVAEAESRREAMRELSRQREEAAKKFQVGERVGFRASGYEREGEVVGIALSTVRAQYIQKDGKVKVAILLPENVRKL